MPPDTKVSGRLGVSFSLHRCSELGIDKKATLKAALSDLGLKRFRLMSYWNVHEPEQERYNFGELDWQFELLSEYEATATLCIGKRQPRWPECHMPQWALALPKEQWYKALYKYIEVVVSRYRNHPALISWQLENEALLKNFGYCQDNDYSHSRLETEYRLVKSLDPQHPVVMTLSDSWGLPWRRPHPDAYAMSLYRATLNKRGKHVLSGRPPVFYKLRADMIYLLHRKNVFIHELQAEPWLSNAITETSVDEQIRIMTPANITENIAFAKKTDQYPIDLWGLEWWYWIKEHHGHPEYWQTIKETIKQTKS